MNSKVTKAQSVEILSPKLLKSSRFSAFIHKNKTCGNPEAAFSYFSTKTNAISEPTIMSLVLLAYYSPLLHFTTFK